MRLGLRAKKRSGVLAAAVVVGAAVLGAASGGGSAGAATLSGGTWGLSQAIPGLAALSGGQYPSSVSAVSCASLGNCTAVGWYKSATAGEHPFAVTETDGTWGSAQSLAAASGAPSSMGTTDGLSCGAPGYCTAVGSYTLSGELHAYLATQVKGAWSVRTLPGTIGSDTVLGSSINSVSCTGAGDCTVVGMYISSVYPSEVDNAFTLDESSGTWGTPQPVAGLPLGGNTSSSPTSSGLGSVSCSGPGDCTAGGSYHIGTAGDLPFLVSESGGTWGSAQAVPGFVKLNSSGQNFGYVTSVSCPDASDCAAIGYYYYNGNKMFTVDEANGTWGSAKELALPAVVSGPPDAITLGLGCWAAGKCVITGIMDPGIVIDHSGWSWPEVFVWTETSGGWGQAQTVPGIPTDGSTSSLSPRLSCVPGGYCTVAGVYGPSGASASVTLYQVFAATIGTDGTVGAAQPVQPAQSAQPVVTAFDCPQDGYCTLAEAPEANDSPAQLVTEANPASVTLTASASKVSYGSEPAETFTATVSAAGGTPTGTVTVTGPSGAACTITLSAGTGKCSFSPAQFPAGTYTATGSYSGDLHYVAASGTATVTVAKGKTATLLTPSAAVIAVGQGATDTLAVTVSHAGGVAPTGTVTVKDGSYAVCTVTLAKGSGSCAVNADQLITHGRVLEADYPGDSNFLASTSPPAYLTIAPAAPRLAWPAAGHPASPVNRLHGAPAPPVG